MKVQPPFEIIGFDPGKLSGIAVVRCNEDESLRLVSSDELEEHEVADYLRFELAGWAKMEGGDIAKLAVVCEKFTITLATAKKSQAPFSLEMIGVLKQCCRDVGYPVESIIMQSPSDAKSVVSNKQLQALDLWHKGGAGHANDALRHVLLFMIKLGYKDSRLLSS